MDKIKERDLVIEALKKLHETQEIVNKIKLNSKGEFAEASYYMLMEKEINELKEKEKSYNIIIERYAEANQKDKKLIGELLETKKAILENIENKIKHFSELAIDNFNKYGNGKETKYCDEQVEFWQRFEKEFKEISNENNA